MRVGARFRRDQPPPDLDLAPGATAEDAVLMTADAPLSVRPSLIPGAGYGLFTTVHLPADVIVEGCTYGGRVLTLMEARRVPFARLSTRRSPRSPPRRAPPPRRRRAPSKEYLMALHFNVHVDATDYPGYLARYVNDNLDDDGARRNARFVKDPERRLARLRTTRPVAPGEELYAEYGEGYWRRHCRDAEEEEDAEPQTDRFGSGEDSGDGAAVRLRGDR